MKSVKILHIIDHYKIGGPGKTILNSAKFIDKNYEIHLGIFQNLEKLRKAELLSAAEAVGIPVVLFDDKKGFNFNTIKKLKKYINTNRITIVHAHGYKINVLAVAIKLLGVKVKIITTLHGWIVNSTKQRGYKTSDRILSCFFDAVVCVSKKIYETLPQITSKRNTTRIVHNAIVLKDYAISMDREKIRKKLCIKNNQKLIGIIGRLSIEKGCLEAVKMFVHLSKKEGNYRGVFIGEGPLYDEIRREIKKNRLEDIVSMVGYQNPVQPYLYGLDLLLCPSFTEGISNVILEAMAMNVPVMATRVGGNPEIIHDQFDGILIEAGKAKEWSVALETLLNDEKKIECLKKNAYKTVCNQFSFQSRMRRIENLYQTVLHQ